MGLGELLRAMVTVRAAHPDACLLIGGTGELDASLREQTRTLGLDGTVRFTGFVPEAELPALYGAADAFVLPTQALEGFGLVTLESLACGTPVLGTPVGATPELLSPLDRSLVFASSSPDAIARGIVEFLGRDAHEALRARCRAHAVSQTWDAAIGRLESDLFPAHAG
jgi:glycosyltransferase involved in cell wall biosynthesis